MSEQEKHRLLYEDPDFILLKRFGFSVKAALERHPEGMKDELIAQALGISDGAVAEKYALIVAALRRKLNV